MRRSLDDMEGDLKQLLKQLRRPRTMDHLTEHFDVDRRTVYRWMQTLQDDGRAVARVGIGRPTQYQILS